MKEEKPIKVAKTAKGAKSTKSKIGDDKKKPFNPTPKNIVVESDKPKLRLVENTVNKITLVITSECEMKIRQLCSMFENTEYSGFLFYRVVSLKDDYSEGKIEAFDLLPMDIGSAGYTTFAYTPDLAKYMFAKGYMGKCYYGLVHSHNVMTTNPSSTDYNTINKEGEDRNNFLSLIVNNAGNYHAFFTRRLSVITTGTITEKYNSFGNDEKVVEKTINKSDSYVEYTQMKIVKSYPNAKEVIDRINEIRKSGRFHGATTKARVPEVNPGNLRTYTGKAGLDEAWDNPPYTSRFDETYTRRSWFNPKEDYEPYSKPRKVDLTNLSLGPRARIIAEDIARDLFTTDKSIDIDLAIELANSEYVKDPTSFSLDNSIITSFAENNDSDGDYAFAVMSVLTEYVGIYDIVEDMIDKISVVFNVEVIY